ncbi:Glutathione S-transferase kappa 1 [Irineochytrium annulatum]|nr:Glutathione S-transferase kappa 1 [Irineochytrium annulatum]
MARIKFFYDTVSPYSLFAFEAIQRYQRLWNVDVDLQPFLLGGVMHASGNRPPGTLAAKATHMAKDLTVLGGLFGCPVNFPTNFPEESLKAQRILTALKMKEPSKVAHASRQMWKLYWHDGRSIQNEADLIEYMSAVVGSQAEQYVKEHASSAEVKAELKRVTMEAIETGAYGSPWMVATNDEGKTMEFFGSDRIEALAYFLGRPYSGPNPGSSKL